MSEPPEVLDAGEDFMIISEVQPLCSADELPCVPASERPSLVDSVPLFGLLLVARGGTLVVKRSRTVLGSSPGGDGSEVWCGGRITHITHACDGLSVFVITVWSDDCPRLLCFDTAALVQQGSSAKPYLECSNSSSAGSRVLGLAVNPTDPACVAYCTSAGDLTVLNISNNSVTYNTKKNMGARALGWSAKGKQMCVGCQDGSLSLHKPDLTPVRTIPAAPLSDGASAPITALVWFTNTEFFVAYQQSNNQPCLVYVNGPKGQPAQYINYEDVCYSNESEEPLFYHLLFIPQWNQLLVLSSGGIEMATLIKTANGGWAQLALEEGSRAEMHFVNVTQETFPLGMTLDLGSTKTFSVKEDTIEGPYPVVVALSTGGELNIFHLVNKLPDKPDLMASLPAQPTPAAPVRTAQQYCSNIVIPPPPRSDSSVSATFTAAAADAGPSVSAHPASSSFAFSSSFANPSSVAGFTATSSAATSVIPSTSSSIFANANSFATYGTSASPLTGVTTVASASTSGASSLFSTLGTTGAGGGSGLFSRSSVPPLSSSSSLFGGASLFNQTKAPTSSLFGGEAAPAANSAAAGSPSSSSPAPAAAFSFAGGSSAFSVPGGNSLLKAPLAAAASVPYARATAPEAASPPAGSPRPAPVAEAVGGGAASTVGSNYRAPASPALHSSRASPSVAEQQQQLAPAGGRSARSAAQEASLLAQTLKEQDLFEAELQEHLLLCARNEYKGEWKTSMEAVQEALQKQKASLDQQQQQVGEVSEGVTALHQDLLEFYSAFETTKAAVHQLKEPRCNQLSEWRGLARSSERQLQQLRDQVLYIQRELSYASAALDSLPSSRGGPAPQSRSSVTTVYRVAQLGRNARVSCEQRLDQLSAKLKQLSVSPDLALPKNENIASTKTGRYGISEESLLVEEKENIHGNMARDKQQQLWAILRRRGHTPVRKSGEAVLSPYASGSGSPLQPRQLHEPSFLSLSFGPGKCSTPNVPEGSSRQAPDPSAGKQGLLDTPKSSWPTSSLSGMRSAGVKLEPVETVVAKYEDITPPGTPEMDTRAQEDNRAVSNHPLSALSSLVGKVPPTAAVGILQGSLTQPQDMSKSSSTGFSFGAFAPPMSDMKFVSNSEKEKLPFFAASSNFSSSLSTGTSTIVTTSSVLFSTGSGVSVTSSTSAGVTSGLFSSSSSSGNIFGGALLQPAALQEAAGSATGGAAVGLDLTTMSTATTQDSAAARTNSDFFTRESLTTNSVNKPSYSAVPASVAEIRNISENGTAAPASLISSTTSSSNSGFVAGVSLFTVEATAPASSASTVVSSVGTATSTFGSPAILGPGGASGISALTFVTKTSGLPATSLFGTPSSTTASLFTTSVPSSTSIFATPASTSSISPITGSSSGTLFSTTSNTSAASSVFGTTASLGSVFGGSITSSSSVFGAAVTASSVFGASVSSSSTFAAPVSSSSVFAVPVSSSSVSAAPVSSSSVLGAPVSSSSVFGAPVSSSSVFGAPVSSSSSVFGTPASSASSAFAAPVSSVSSVFPTPASSASSVFAAPASSASSVFAAPASSASSVFAVPASSASSVFAAPASLASSVFAAPASSASSVFAAPASSASSVFATPAASSSSVFATPAASSSSIFATPASSSSSIFATPASSSSSIFATPASSSSSIFATPASSSNSIFATPASSSSSIFATPASSASSVFGATATSSTSMFGSLSSSGSVFGAPAFSSTGPVFGAPASTAASVFGAPASTAASVFGAPASTAASAFGATPSSGSLFVTNAASAFGGSGSVFGAPSSSSGSLFGTSSAFGATAVSTQSSVFGSSSAFGGKPTQSAGGLTFGSSSSVFGGAASTPSASMFGGAAAAAGASTSSASIFGGAVATSTSSASMFGGGGQAGSFGSTNANVGGSVFGGGVAAFGSPSSSSVFGGAAGGGGGSSSSMFGGGAILTGLGSAAPANSTNKNIFGISGSAVKPQTDLFGGSGSEAVTVSSAPSLFGGSSSSALSKPASAFGAAPAFGSPPKFGSAPAFGSPPAFGGSVFGGASAPQSGNGSSTGGGFSSFANSSGTATFGGFAASGSGSSNSSFGAGNSSPFTSSGIGGGSSFTSWR